LQSRPQWVAFILQPKPDGKTTKPPINPHIDPRAPLKERLADPTNPTTWGTYEQALQAVSQGRSYGYHGVGFVLTADDPLCAIDFDHILHPGTKTLITPWAKRAILGLASYTEPSPSGDGIHVWCQANLELLQTHLGLSKLAHKNRARGIEIYDRARYVTWTGSPFGSLGREIALRQQEVEAFYRAFLLEQTASTPSVPATPSSEELQKRGNTCTRVFSMLDDATIIERASLGEKGARFRRLFAGDASDYPLTNQKHDISAADLALCGILAYWTGKDPTQMDRIFRQSGLYRLDKERQAKWDRLGERTIQLAIANCHRVYDPEWAQAHRFQPATRTPAPTGRVSTIKGGN
jgi:primase-polymerase (primpol)-like protein